MSPRPETLAAALQDSGSEQRWRQVAKQGLIDGDAELHALYWAGTDIDALLRARAALVDAVLRSRWSRDFDALGGAALFATGGYGRGELFPYSDVDLLLLAGVQWQLAQRERIEAFWAALWDIGLTPGHAVRDLAQCAATAAADLTVITSLAEARLLSGDPTAAAALREAIAIERLWSPQEYFDGKRDEQRQRHARYNDTAYNLEPNLKEGPGGLRDVQTLRWMAQRIHGVNELQELLVRGALGSDECATLERERRNLSHIRYGLHLVAGRREERLLFDHQLELARRLGLRDEHREKLAVEQLMQSYFRSAALVLRLNARLLQRFEEQLAGPQAASAQPIDAEFERRHGHLALRDTTLFTRDPHAILRLFAVWQAHPDLRGLHSETARALGEALPLIGEDFRADPENRRAFVALLRSVPDCVESLARMSRMGVLGRYLPAFGRVAGRMQYDLFHVYTVDQHTLVVLHNVASFAGPAQERFALAHEVWPRLRKPELLILAALFHDIAKGRGGDHSELGAVEAQQFCQAHDFSAADTGLVAWLVSRHLLMSVTAQRQDIADPDVVRRFADVVADRERLDYLYLLTLADISGTSPKLWNAWKDRLLADLYTATRFELRRGPGQPLHATERAAETRQSAAELLRASGMDDAAMQRVWDEFPQESFLRYSADQLAWQTRGIAADGQRERPLVLARPHARPGALEVFVYSPDRDGLFAAVTATLDRLGLSVVDARVVTSRREMSLDTFQVLDPGVDYVSPQRRAETVASTLDEVLSRTPAQVRPARRALPRQLRHFRIPVHIEIRDAPVAGRSELVLVCADRPGLLAQVAAVLRAQKLRVHEARIATFGERVEDFFQITDQADRPLRDPQRIEALRIALSECVDTAQANDDGTKRQIHA